MDRRASRLAPLLLTGWLIMEPPLMPWSSDGNTLDRPIYTVRGDGYLVRKRANTEAPLSEWKQVGGADSLDNCEKQRQARAPAQREWGEDRIKIKEPDLRPYSRCVPSDQVYPQSR